MGFELIIVQKAQEEIIAAVEWYESKQSRLGADFMNYLEGIFKL